jgi:hypothetical protein
MATGKMLRQQVCWLLVPGVLSRVPLDASVVLLRGHAHWPLLLPVQGQGSPSLRPDSAPNPGPRISQRSAAVRFGVQAPGAFLPSSLIFFF